MMRWNKSALDAFSPRPTWLLPLKCVESIDNLQFSSARWRQRISKNKGKSNQTCTGKFEHNRRKEHKKSSMYFRQTWWIPQIVSLPSQRILINFWCSLFASFLSLSLSVCSKWAGTSEKKKKSNKARERERKKSNTKIKLIGGCEKCWRISKCP